VKKTCPICAEFRYISLVKVCPICGAPGKLHEVDEIADEFLKQFKPLPYGSYGHALFPQPKSFY
jgi:hypothetical protein